MANRLKLNEKILRDAEPQEGNSYQIFDTEILGLAAKVQSSGSRTFTLDYRFAGRQRRLTIGRWPEWSVTAAREPCVSANAAAFSIMQSSSPADQDREKGQKRESQKRRKV